MRKGFTYIEVLITLAVMAVLFVPMMRFFSYGLASSAISGEIITGVYLARGEMERIKNLNVSKKQLKKIGDIWRPELDEPPLEANKARWRLFTHINPESDPIEVTVQSFLAGNLRKPVVTLVTLVEDSVWLERKQ